MVTLMLADDELLVRSGIKLALSEFDMNISIIGEAANGVEALNIAVEKKPDILITDIKMPLMDGLELIRRMREKELTTQLIIISGYADFEFAKEAMKYGVSHYVLKPIKSAELEEAVKACIAKTHDVLNDSDSTGAAQLISFIKLNYNKNMTLEELASRFNFSTKYLTHLVKKQTGKSFTDYITELRIEMAAALLRKTEMKIKEIASYVGYDDTQYFHRVFKNKIGQTPAQYRQDKAVVEG